MKQHRESPRSDDEGSGPAPAPVEAEDRLRAEVDEWKGKYQRALADFSNYQRRAVENEREARRQGTVSAISSLLGVLDNFDLALKHEPGKASAESMARGVSMIKNQMVQALSSLGVTMIEPTPGDEFDPRRHEAVAHVPGEGVEPGRIAGLFQTGYAMGDWVLRPAKVSIAREPDADAP